MAKHHLAQINIARMKGVNIDDPIMAEFVANLDRVNALAESSKGFVWRLQDADNNATSLNPYDDEQVIINVSVWENIESLETFVYKTFHTDFLKRRREWFAQFGKAYTAMWWIPKGELPNVEMAIAKLTDLQNNGATELVFDFKNKFAAPE